MNTTVSSGIDHWCKVHAIDAKPRTVTFHNEIASIIRANCAFLSKAPESVTESEVLEFCQTVSHYCPSRWNAVLSMLKFVPALRVLKRRPLRFTSTKPPDQTEFRRLLEELDSRPNSAGGIIIRFLALTGLRINEARGLKWSDVRSDCIVVPANVTKSGKARVIPFVDGTKATLERLKQLSPGPFIMPQKEVKTSLKTACERAGLPVLSHHDFRHLFATRCIESGVDTLTVARWLGHQDGGALLSRLYFHLLDGHSRSMAARVTIV